MAKFCGIIGYSMTIETSPGVWEDKIVERKHYGDVLKKAFRWQKGEGINDDIAISNDISIVADSFARKNIGYMKYVKFMNATWSISSMELEYPRIKITLGGLYNDEVE